MNNMKEDQLKARGGMAILMDEIKALSRERDNLLRPLKDRINRAMPGGQFPPEIANVLDCGAAKEELESINRVEDKLSEAVLGYNRLADSIGFKLLQRSPY